MPSVTAAMMPTVAEASEMVAPSERDGGGSESGNEKEELVVGIAVSRRRGQHT
jgi:hypothetical protein